MKEKTWFGKMLDAVKDSFEFRLETIILDITEQISKRMKERQINRTQLAKALDVTPAAVTKILNGNSNFTLKTLLTIGDALNLDLAVDFRPKEKPAEVQHFLVTCAAHHGFGQGVAAAATYTTVTYTGTTLTGSMSAASSTKLILPKRRQEDEYKWAA